MKEDFLQSIWQMQNFLLPAESTDGCSIRVLKAGNRNREDGPDFLHARIAMDGLEWIGSVEVHVRSGEWYAHGHQLDPVYDGVILHVVWEEDRPIFRRDGSRIPALELKHRVSLNLLLQYRKLLNTESRIPCSGLNQQIPEILRVSMLETALAERLMRKSAEILERHKACGFDWHLTAAICLARSLGMPGNEDPMENLVRNLPKNLLRNRMPCTEERMVFFAGQSGLKQIQNQKSSEGSRYKNHQQAGNLQVCSIPWKTRGRRPSSFPAGRVKLLDELLNHLSEWPDFGPEPDFVNFVLSREMKLPEQLQRHLKINFQASYQLARALLAGDTEAGNRAMEYLQHLKAEDNRLTRQLKTSGFYAESAAQSQGGKELLDAYCSKKRCMECQIGQHLIKNPISSE